MSATKASLEAANAELTAQLERQGELIKRQAAAIEDLRSVIASGTAAMGDYADRVLKGVQA